MRLCVVSRSHFNQGVHALSCAGHRHIQTQKQKQPPLTYPAPLPANKGFCCRLCSSPSPFFCLPSFSRLMIHSLFLGTFFIHFIEEDTSITKKRKRNCIQVAPRLAGVSSANQPFPIQRSIKPTETQPEAGTAKLFLRELKEGQVLSTF